MPGDRPKICASLVNDDLEAVKKVEPLCDLFELRIDLIGDGWREVAKNLSKPWSACNRRAEEGGGWKARRRRVSARGLPFDPTLIEVSSGLRDGERVAVSGVRALRDGVAVRSHDVALGSLLVGGEADGDAS